MIRSQLVLAAVAAVVLFGAAIFLGGSGTSPTTVRSFIDILDERGVECRLSGEIEDETSVLAPGTRISLEHSTCRLDGAEVTVWTFGSEQDKNEFTAEDISGHGRNWFIDASNWSAATRSEAAARAIHEVLDGDLLRPSAGPDAET